MDILKDETRNPNSASISFSTTHCTALQESHLISWKDRYSRDGSTETMEPEMMLKCLI